MTRRLRAAESRSESESSAAAAIVASTQVLVDYSVARDFTAEILNNPAVEVGGKYVGFIRGGPIKARSIDDRLHNLSSMVFEVVGYLEDGPRAQRTPTFHMGDGIFQDAQFRELERRWPDIEHLGSWHSHHPNGLAELSDGDVAGYHETVNSIRHHSDYFLVGLGIDRHGFDTSKHYLFVRDWDSYVSLRPLSIILADLRGRLPGWVSTDSGPEARSALDSPLSERTRTAAHDDYSLRRPTGSSNVDPENEPSKERLLADQAWVNRRAPYLRLRRREDRLVWSGMTEHGRARFVVSYLYASNRAVADGAVEVNCEAGDGLRTVSIRCFGAEARSIESVLDLIEHAGRCLQAGTSYFDLKK